MYQKKPSISKYKIAFNQKAFALEKKETRVSKVHDLVLDFIMYLSQEQSFFITLGSFDGNQTKFVSHSK